MPGPQPSLPQVEVNPPSGVGSDSSWQPPRNPPQAWHPCPSSDASACPSPQVKCPNHAAGKCRLCLALGFLAPETARWPCCVQAAWSLPLVKAPRLRLRVPLSTRLTEPRSKKGLCHLLCTSFVLQRGEGHRLVRGRAGVGAISQGPPHPRRAESPGWWDAPG